MRKRAQRKSIPVESVEKQVDKRIGKKLSKNKKFRINKKWWIAGSLIAIFLMVLMLNTYFNVAGGAPFNEDGTGFDKYYLSGPDPYYNMRHVEETLYGENAGYYQFYNQDDPLLNYPLGRSGGRGPFMNVLAIGFGQLMTPVMDEVDAVGLAMQFLPALFGALLVFPIYFIGKTLFSRKVGLLAALFIALIPVHLGSGHGSAYALFDHDSINMFLIVTSYFFLIKGVTTLDVKKSSMYALLAGLPLAALTMLWVEAEYLFTIIALYAIIQIIIDIYLGKKDFSVPRTTSITLFTGYLLSLPVIASKGGFSPDLNLYLALGVAVFGALYYLFSTKRIPWTLSLPSIFGLGAAGVVFLYFLPMIRQYVPFVGGLNKIRDILFGAGIYGNKVSMTIAEAGTYDISRTVMSFGPTLFWIAWIGFFMVGYHYVTKNHRRDHFFLLLLFIIQIWFIGIAGRFINDLIPPIILLSSFFIWLIIDKIDYTAMIKSVKRVGGLQGIRKGVSFLHVFGILFIAFLLILPNAYLALDAAVPATEKNEVFGDLPSGAFGSSFGKEQYWVDAYQWFATQDTEIKNPADRPAYISWWDYGFYGVAVGGHPVVADNFQDGIPPASNFHTSTSEQEAVSVWIIRLLEGNAREGPISTTIVTTLKDYLDETDANNFVSWVEEPTSSPSYGEPIAPEYGKEFSQDYPVGQQWPENAVYHDGMDLLTSELSDEELTMLYRDIQDLTGNSIRYYGVEGYDRQIFNIFGFLADRSLLMVAGEGKYSPEDDFVQVKYVTQSGQEIPFEDVMNRTDIQNRQDPIVNTKTIYKDPYFETMFYKTYIGIVQADQSGQKTIPQYQIPCQDMKHFYAQYISPYPEYAYNQGQSAVVIAKYYEGAIINGTISFLDEPKDFDVIVQQNISHYGTEIPVAHDTNTSVNGSYEVIVPAGDVTLQVQRYPELGQNAFVMMNVTFSDDGMHSVITEEEATRSTLDYQRQVDIEMPTSSIEGIVFDNMDDSTDVYNESTDSPIEGATVSIIGYDAFDPNQLTPISYDAESFDEIKTDANGYFNFSSLLSGYYQFTVRNADGFQLETNPYLTVKPGKNWHNVSKPQEGNIKGTAYFDENENGAYDTGEEIADASIDLVYTGTNEVVESMSTDASGRFESSYFLPGAYELDINKLPDYELTTSVTIPEGDTLTQNISIQYAKIEVTGETIREDTSQPVSNINITFAVDTTVENNTANGSAAASDADGTYSLELMPGTYTVDVAERVNESGTMVQYTFSGSLTISVGQDPISYDITLAREEE
jgi:dolichyl-phosphooligosaccharide-protein glycotransferase